MISPRATIAKLRARVAADNGPEADVARTALRELELRYPTEAALADADVEPQTLREFPVKGRHESVLFSTLCRYLGVVPLQYKRGHRPRGKSVRLAEGPASLLDTIGTLFAHLRRQLEELHWGTTCGFVLGALPLPPSEDEDDGDEDDSPSLTADQRAAAFAAMRVGRAAQPRRQLVGAGAKLPAGSPATSVAGTES